MAETPKRLAPTRDTLRELYLKSGNRCAFPECKKALFNGLTHQSAGLTQKTARAGDFKR